MVIVNTLFQEHKRRLHMDIIRWKILKSGWWYSLQSKMGKLYTVIKNKTGSWSESESCSLCDPMYYTVHGILQAKILEWIFPFPGDLPNPWIEPKFLHCRWILYQLCHKGSMEILEWVAYPFSRRASWPRNRNGVSWIAGRFFKNWALRETGSWLWLRSLTPYSKIQTSIKESKENHEAIQVWPKSNSLPLYNESDK